MNQFEVLNKACQMDEVIMTFKVLCLHDLQFFFCFFGVPSYHLIKMDFLPCHLLGLYKELSKSPASLLSTLNFPVINLDSLTADDTLNPSIFYLTSLKFVFLCLLLKVQFIFIFKFIMPFLSTILFFTFIISLCYHLSPKVWPQWPQTCSFPCFHSASSRAE